MNLRYLVLPVFMLFLLSGCTHFSMDQQKETASYPQRDESSDKIFHNGQLIEHAGIRASDLSAAGEGEADSAVDSDAEAVSNLETKSNGLGLDPVSTQKIQTKLDEALELCELSQEYWQQGELENAVETLDRAYALILSVDTSDRPKLIQQKEDLRFMISKRILEIYASRNVIMCTSKC